MMSRQNPSMSYTPISSVDSQWLSQGKSKGQSAPLTAKKIQKIGKNWVKEGKNLEKEEKWGRKGKGLSLCPPPRLRQIGLATPL